MNMARISKLIIVYSFIFSSSLLWGQQPAPQLETFELVEFSPGRIVFTLKPFQIKVNSLQIENKTYQELLIPDYGVTSEPGFPRLPTTAALIPIPRESEVKVMVLESAFEEIADISIPPAPYVQEDFQSEQVSYEFKEDAAFYRTDAYWPIQLAGLTSRGHLRGQLIGRIQVNPVQYNPVQKKIRIYKKLKVQVTFREPLKINSKNQTVRPDLFRTLSQSLLLTPPESITSERRSLDLNLELQQSDWYNPQFNYYKLFVDEEGIYELTYDDLVNAGIPVELFNLDYLKIFNQGKQIPLWIKGPQSGVFTPENTVYFYGDWHRGSESYFDFYTDTNVYWLTADGEVGKRYQVMEKNGLPVIPASFYWETLHLEEEKIFHSTNRTSPVDEGEGWIWRYFFDDDRETMKFKVMGLFESVTECSLKVRLHGTTKDPVNPDHHVSLSINDQIVGEAFFDEQEEFIWELSFPAQFLHEGENEIELHLDPDTGAQLNQIYLDWLEIIYPRVHAAVQSNLKFQDTNPTGLLTEYTLVNFEEVDVTIFEPAHGRLWQPHAEKMSFYRVESAGFEDGNYAKMTVDFETVYYNKVERGHNLVTIYPKTGEKEMRHFDTFLSPDSANAMADFIFGLPDSTVVIAAIMDEGTLSMTENAHQALESLGSALTRDVQGRDSWALIGWKGATVGSVKEALSRRFDGPAMVADTLRGELAFRFSAAIKDTSSANNFYYAISRQGAKKVKAILKDQGSHLRSSQYAADYIIITHENFKEEAERLADYRSQQNGFRCFVVDVQDIYDEFNAGVMTAQAIKDFLTHAYFNWQKPAPSFLVLFGDASWDPKMLSDKATKINYVPSYGILVADNWFVSLDGPNDFLPDMFTGRIPVETVEQAALVVDKIISYENLPFDAWNKEFIFLNGGFGSTEQSIFLSQAERLIAEHIAAPPFHGKAFNFNKDSDDHVTQSFWPAVAAEIKQGVQWVNFLGHAGSTVWDIDIRQPEDWQNSKIFPFMTGMSCHSARYANPTLNSLGESYFINTMGASGYWGSSGFGFITQDFYLLDGLFKAIARDTVRSVGVATTFAKWHLWQRLGDQPRNRNVIDQYTLLGDPAMNLVIPEKPELTVHPEDIAFETDVIILSDSTTAISTQVQNYGLLPQDSVGIQLSAFDEEDNLSLIETTKVKPFGNVDSLSFIWNLPVKPGAYRLQVNVDPENTIDEEDETNNNAESTVFVFASDLTIIKPLEYGIVNSSSPELVTNSSRTLNEDLVYYFEIDTSVHFDSPLLQQSSAIPEAKLATQWQPLLSIPAVYYWRARTFDGENFGSWAKASFTYSPASSMQWQQSSLTQFNKNILNKVESVKNGEARLKQNIFIFKAESAGFVEGSYAYLWRNDEFFYENKRGHNLAVFDETDGEFISKSSFDSFIDAANSEAMAQYINNIPDGRIVLAAIHDEGSFSMTENAYLAVESLGSVLTRQVGYRDSWAIIGRKGADIGSVPEVMSKSGEGAITASDTVHLFSKMGNMVSTTIGPATQWKSVQFSYDSAPPLNGIEFNLLGKNQTTGQLDSLKAGVTGVEILDISDINAKLYPEIHLEAVLFSEDGLKSPVLEYWAVDFTPAPDLVIGKGSIQMSSDTVSVGADVEVSIDVGNFGLSPADSFAIRLFTRDIQINIQELSRIRIAGLAMDEIKQYDTVLSTSGLDGKVTINVEVDADLEITELHETNNEFTFDVWVVRDTTSPNIRVTFNDRGIGEGEFVSANPQVIVQIWDAGFVAFGDTAQVSVLLDEQKVVYGSGPDQAQFIPQQNPDEPELKALAIFQPQLTEGEHQIEVIAKDEAANMRYFQAHFLVSSDFLITNVMNYPNPFRNETEFTYNLTQDADQVRLKMYTISGRLIQEMDFLPAGVGFNQFLWDGRDRDGDTLSNGVYLYKIIARKGDQQVEVVEKFVVMR